MLNCIENVERITRAQYWRLTQWVAGRTALEVLQDFGDAAPPLEWLLQAMPHLKPRYFSIASSPRAHPGQAHITAAVVEYATPHRRRKVGVATSWLAGLQPGSPEARVCAPLFDACHPETSAALDDHAWPVCAPLLWLSCNKIAPPRGQALP